MELFLMFLTDSTKIWSNVIKIWLLEDNPIFFSMIFLFCKFILKDGLSHIFSDVKSKQYSLF